MLPHCLAWAFALVLTSPGADLSARQAAQSPPIGTGLVAGRVVDGSSDRPLASVIVRLTGAPVPPPTTAGSPARPPSVITDNNGRFLFRNLPPGRYSFEIVGTGGPIPGGFGARRPGGAGLSLELADGERLGDVTLRAWRPASISGRVLDHSGDPLVESKVAAMRVENLAGVRRYGPPKMVMTDDRGVYRISQLAPGDYVAFLPFTQVTLPRSVIAESDRANAGGQDSRMDFQMGLASSGAPSLSGTGFQVGDAVLVRTSTSYGFEGPIGPMFSSPAPTADGRMQVYPFAYLGGATRLADATVLTLDSGQDRTGTDFQTRLVNSVRLSGRVRNPDGPAEMLAIHLIPQSAVGTADDRTIEVATTICDTNGGFTLLGVPAGQYVLKVGRTPQAFRPPTPTSVTTMGPGGGMTTFTSSPAPNLPPPPLPNIPTLWAALPVSVGDTDLVNLDVVLQRGARLSGRVEYEGTRARPTADQLQRLVVSVTAIDDRSAAAAGARGQLDANGQFASNGLLPGRYLIGISSVVAGWRLKSVVAGGRDVSDLPLEVGASDIAGVVITLTDRESGLSGGVRDATGAADPNATVLVFPTDRQRWPDGSAGARRERAARVSSRGTYDVSNLPPGEYFVVAVDDAETANWQDPRRLEAFARSATRVTIVHGEPKGQDLVTARIR